MSNSPDFSFPRRIRCVRVLPLNLHSPPNRRVGGAPKGASSIVVAPVKARVSRVCETRRASCEACMTRSPLGAPPWLRSPAHSPRRDERQASLATSPLRLRIISGNALNERGFCFSSITSLRSQERSYAVATIFFRSSPRKRGSRLEIGMKDWIPAGVYPRESGGWNERQRWAEMQ
jgi:hypothetical protein